MLVSIERRDGELQGFFVKKYSSAKVEGIVDTREEKRGYFRSSPSYFCPLGRYTLNSSLFQSKVIHILLISNLSKVVKKVYFCDYK